MKSTTAPKPTSEREAPSASSQAKPSIQASRLATPPRPRLRRALHVALILLGAGIVWWMWPRAPETDHLNASGTIEGTQVDVAPKVSGRLLALRTKDGQRVEKDQVVAVLDGVDQRHQLSMARAALAENSARLDQARIALSQQIAQQRASEKQSAANLEGANIHVPQADVTRLQADRSAAAQIAQARAQVETAVANEGAARFALSTAQAQARSARAANRRATADFRRYQQLYAQDIISAQQWDVTVATADSARAQLQAAEGQVQVAAAQLKAAEHSIAQARAALAAADTTRLNVALRGYDYTSSIAQRAQARAGLELTRSNAALVAQRQRESEAATALVHQAEAALAQARTNLDYTVLRAPFRGVVLSHNVEVGDLVAVGGTVVTVADLDHPYLRIYVGEKDFARVRLGEPVEVRVDAYPGRVYQGRVDEMKNRAEYTLDNVQTREDRIKLVYGIRIRVDNPDWSLKPGLPADAVIRPVD